MTHAFFKALLFLAAGSVIIAMHHEQDIRKMGGLRKYMPITYWTCLIGSLALIGFPGFSGLLLQGRDHRGGASSRRSPAAALRLLVRADSACSSRRSTRFRLVFLVFHGKERMDEHTPRAPARDARGW